MKISTGIAASAALVAAIFIAGCGAGGSAAAPPTGVTVAAKDSRLVVSWTTVPGVEYWLFKAAGAGVTPSNCSSMSSCTTILNATSPSTLSGLPNGTLYSVSINGRIGGGPGGAGSTAISATPRMAGDIWTAGAATGSNALRGVAFGAMWVAAGVGGELYSSTDGATWNTLTNPVSGTDLFAVNYDSYRAKYLGVGANGTVISMTPAASSTWTQQTSNTANTLRAATNNAAGTTVAVGAGGTIISSSDGSTWTPRTSGTASALNGVAYGYDNTNAQNIYVAVGAARTLLYSTDGTTWTAGTCATCVATPDLNGVVYGAAAGVFVAVGAGGAVLTSSDGISWTPQTTTITNNLNAITFTASRRFVAVGDAGVVYYSEYTTDGATWVQATQATATPLYAVATGSSYDYLAVGASGFNVYSD